MKISSIALALAVGTGVLGCGSKEAGSGASGQNTVAHGGRGAPPATSGPAGTVDPGCTKFEDRTDENAERTIYWKSGLGSSAERCMKIKAGQSVVFEGALTKHPIRTAKGDSPSPITEVQANVSNPGLEGQERSNAQFGKPGTFGYVCDKDASMKGAIQVVP